MNRDGRMMVSKTSDYGSIAVAREVGISLRQLYYWVHVLRVAHPRMRRHGMRRFRRFSTQDLRKLKAVKRFVEKGYTLKAAVRASIS
ncbi:MAG: MerR family transcriptional regulator [Nitrososphaera sp.]|nr:MerR family transcriptional regulator [Nitrososphaera sp.]